MTKKLLFVCLGNICRSPAAEAILKKKLQDSPLCHEDITVDSAGIGAWHVGPLPDHRMRLHGEQHGYDISSRARQIKPQDFDHFDWILAMDNQNVVDLKKVARNLKDAKKIRLATDFMTQHPGQATVPDPYYGGDSDFEWAIELIEDACDGIIKELEKEL